MLELSFALPWLSLKFERLGSTHVKLAIEIGMGLLRRSAKFILVSNSLDARVPSSYALN